MGGAAGGLNLALQTNDIFAFPTYSETVLLMTNDGVSDRVGYGIFGYQTPAEAVQNAIDMSIAAGYSGDALLILDVAGVGTTAAGASAMFIDFGAGTVAGSVFSGTDTDLNIVDGVLTTDGISGGLSISVGHGVVASLDPSSSFSGNFYGNIPVEISVTI